jgi:hypothetical protein
MVNRESAMVSGEWSVVSWFPTMGTADILRASLTIHRSHRTAFSAFINSINLVNLSTR